VLLLPALGGCFDDSFGSASRLGKSSLPDPNLVPVTQVVELVLPPESSTESDELTVVSRMEAARNRMLFSVTRPSVGDPTARQADLIRGVARRKNSFLLIEPLDVPEIAQAIEDVRAAGTPIVAVGRDVPVKDQSKVIPAVTFEKSDEPAKKLVDAVIRDVRAGGLPADGHALMLVKPVHSAGIDEMVSSLRSALHARGVRNITLLPVTGNYTKDGKDVEESLAADPAVTIVIAVEVDGVNAAMAARESMKSAHGFWLGGVLSMESEVPPLTTSAFSGLLDRNVSELGRQAVKLVLARSRNEKVPDRVELPITFKPRPAKPEPDSVVSPASRREPFPSRAPGK
jgi:ABC-type sugar transport system substrate-binding protein